MLDGASIWPKSYPAGWRCSGNGPNQTLDMCDAPYRDVSTYYRATDRKSVVFYSFNYWGVLVWLKCSQLVNADTRLTGDLKLPFFIAGTMQGNAAYCNKRFGSRFASPIPDGRGIEPGTAARSPPKAIRWTGASPTV